MLTKLILNEITQTIILNAWGTYLGRLRTEKAEECPISFQIWKSIPGDLPVVLPSYIYQKVRIARLIFSVGEGLTDFFIR